MKKIRKYFIALASALVFAYNGFAMDFGGLLNNTSTIKTNSEQNFKLDQRDTGSLWIKTVFDESCLNYFIAEAVYDFEDDIDADVVTNIIDTDLFKLSLGKKISNGRIGFSAGRFFYSDLSGIAYVQNADGILFDYSNNRFGISVYGAYTGLLNALNVKMITVETGSYAKDTDRVFDKNDDSFYRFKAPARDTDKVYDLAEKYAVAGLTVSFPNLFARQSLSAQFLGTFRLEDELLNRMYATLSLNGPVVGSLYYGAASTVAFTKFHTEGTDVSMLAKGNMDYYFSKMGASLGCNVTYASGNNGGFSGFTGFTSMNPTSSQLDLEYSGILKFGLASSIKPVDELQVTASCDAIIDVSNGDSEKPTSVAAAMPDYSYTGFQYAVGVNWQVCSDVLFAANVSQFFDKDNTDSIKKTAIGIKAVLSF